MPTNAVLTLVGEALRAEELRAAADALAAAGVVPQELVWIEPARACDLHCRLPDAGGIAVTGAGASAAADNAIALQREVLQAVRSAVPGARDFCLQPCAERSKRLFLADMDATIVNCECLDELAEAAGLGSAVAALTAQAMAGSMDFPTALRQRVAMLAAARVDIALVQHVLRTRVRLNPGARTLLATLRAHGCTTLLVSGGFDGFVEPVARELGFSGWRCNRFVVEAQCITGVTDPIVGREAKLAALEEQRSALAVPAHAVLAIGDGANDIPMLQAAGLGVAWRAKPLVQAAVSCRLDHNPLSALLHFCGIPRAAWVEPSGSEQVNA